ncbi:MAG: hypothetical protein QNJ04_01990 [Desulfobacterales bacterium]|nr:hypothetical protein [Desulfobacterales bacterium]
MRRPTKLFRCLPLLAMLACAQHPVHHATFDAVDQDDSGTIEWREFKETYPEASPKSYLEADKNKDGDVAPGEWEAYIQRFAP